MNYNNNNNNNNIYFSRVHITVYKTHTNNYITIQMLIFYIYIGKLPVPDNNNPTPFFIHITNKNQIQCLATTAGEYQFSHISY